jgi:glycosyltransferase involved in cell wall biosynthesis
VVTVPNGVSKAEIESVPDAGAFWERFPELIDRRVILFLSRVHEKKGLNHLAAALPVVRQIYPEAHVVVAGPDDGYGVTARRLFAETGSAEAVTFTGLLDGVLKRAALAAAEVYVLPSYSEGFSMSVLEAMAAAKPCVITHGCNFPEAAEAGAAHVVAAEAGPVGDALLACLRDPAEAKLMGKRAKELVSTRYTWDAVARQLVDVYEGILGKTRTPDGGNI